MEKVSKIQKISVKTLSMDEMEKITAGSGFCSNLAVYDVVYEAGCMANIWNPLGEGGSAILLGLNAYCAFTSW